MHTQPRFCSYNIPISKIACGQSHSAFITQGSSTEGASALVYTMGSNASGQLGIEDPYVQ